MQGSAGEFRCVEECVEECRGVWGSVGVCKGVLGTDGCNVHMGCISKNKQENQTRMNIFVRGSTHFEVYAR